MRFFITAILVLFTTQSLFSQEINRDPLKAKLVTSDIDLFWKAYDLAAKTDDSEEKAKIFDDEYIGKGSEGLKGFLSNRIRSGKSIVWTLSKYPKFYASIRKQSLRSSLLEPQIQKSFVNLKELYDEAVFPNVYFVIGRLNSGGTTSNAGLLIGMEMYCRNPNTPMEELTDWHRNVLAPLENLPHIVAHESIHFQQRVPQKTLLEKAIQEGSADLVAEIISGKHINYAQHEYGDANERKVWTQFEREMNGEDLSNWLYNGNSAKEMPSDMAYYVGYKISKAYYDRAKDKKQAIRKILNFKDAQKLLDESGYADKFKNVKVADKS